MAKFSLSLRKSLAIIPFSRTASKSEISGSPVDPLAASLEDDRHQVSESSGTLPSNLGQMKPKQFFSFRSSNRRTGLAVSQLVKVSDTRSVGRLGLQGGAESNPDMTKFLSKSKKAPTFATLFFRKSMPSWRSKRGLRIKSDSLKHSPALGDEEATPSESEASSQAGLPVDLTPILSPRDAQPVTGKQDLLVQYEFHESWSPSAENLGLGGVLSDVWSPSSESQSEAPVFSDWESSKSSIEIGSWSRLPIPPIIISAPTPPNALSFADQSAQGLGHLAGLGPERKMPSDIGRTKFSRVPVVVKMLQNAARQLANDPSFTQTNNFRISAPITAFLYTLGIAVVVLKMDGVILGEPGIGKASQTRIAVYSTIVVPLGMLLVLALLRGVIWVMSKLGRSFCELDLEEEVFSRGIFVDSEGERLTEADFIVGNLIA